MLKKIVAAALIAAILTLCPACRKEKPDYKDTFTNAAKWGNTLATEQGDRIALRGEKDGKVGLVLYNKKDDSGSFLVEGDIYHIAMTGNKIYFKYQMGSELYCYDLQKEEYEEVLSGVMAYQIHGGILYYISDEHGPFLYTLDLATRADGKIEMKHTVNAFWVTDHALYYHDDAKNLFIVKPFETDLESIIYRGIYEDCRDAVSLEGGADIAFLIKRETTDAVTLATYNAEKAEVTKHFTGTMSHFNLVGDRLVFVEDEIIVSVDYKNQKEYDWGTTEGLYYPQVLSDCIVLYDSEGQKPSVLYYPE